MNEPLVTLLMAAYNNAGFIKAAIDSVVAQTYENWELIVVDDGSYDGTYELAMLASLKDKRVKVVRNASNMGVNYTLKRAHSLALGEFIAHFDSDDLLERWAIEEMLGLFFNRPELVFVYSDFAQIGRNGEHEAYCPSRDFDKNALHQHGWRHFGMYRADVFNHIQGYNEALFATKGCGDGDLFMQIAEKFPNEIMRLPKVLYFYRNHGNNITLSMKKCGECGLRDKCNYIRVWSKSANYNPITFTPLEQQHERI